MKEHELTPDEVFKTVHPSVMGPALDARLRVIQDRRGHIAWRWGTGDNVELTHLKASEEGKGYGKSLLRDMLTVLKQNPPYATVFGFTRTVNLKAQAFYQDNGFILTRVAGVYDDGGAVVFSARYKDLCELHGVT